MFTVDTLVGHGSTILNSHKKFSLPGYALSDGKCLWCSGLSRRLTLSSYSCHGNHKIVQGANFPQKSSYGRMGSVVCLASSNNRRRNPDFSRQQKGSSGGKNKHYQEREISENIEESDLLTSKNGPLLSLTNNPRYQATATPGRREKEIVELFRKVQAQLRERAAIKEEKKIESAKQGQGERGTVDSLLKLLRKHSVDQRKKSGGEEDYNLDQPERSSPFEEEQNSNSYGPNTVASGKVREPDTATVTRPTSNFRRKSPVPRVKFQTVFSAEEEDINSTSSLKSEGKKETAGSVELEPVPDVESVSLDETDETVVDNHSDLSDTDEAFEATLKSSATENVDLGSLKLSELRELAKSRGIKGYSKLKKGELVELLSGNDS